MRIRFALLASFLAAAPALAQVAPAAPQPGEELVDGVIAVVGDTVLLRSDILLAVEAVRAGGQPVPTEPAAYGQFVRQLVEERVNDLLVLEAARQSGVAVSDAEVQESVDQQIAEIRQRFGGDAAFQQALAESGRTPETYRAELSAQFRDQTIVQRYLRQRIQGMAPAPVSEAEVAAFFEQNRERFGTRPASVSFQQVIVRPLPSDSARAAALATVAQVQKELAEGVDFEVLARRYSADGSSTRGGDLGWFRQGQMVREFNDAVFNMRPGQTVGPVETEFGFHVIRLDKVRGPERQARHILIRPIITQADVDRARVRADSVATAIRGGADIAVLGARYRTPDEARFQREVPLDRLPPGYVTSLEGAQAGTVVGPVRIDVGTNAAFAVMRVTGRQTQGEYTVADQRERIRQMLQEQRMSERVIQELRRDMHVAISSQ
jgi:peptidyl-prolyl cis-trans isomerase SurA